MNVSMTNRDELPPALLTEDEWEDTICDAIREAQAEDCADFGGGVSVAELSRRIPEWKRKTISEHVTDLTDEGVLRQRSGVGHENMLPRPSYVIVEDEEDEQ